MTEDVPSVPEVFAQFEQARLNYAQVLKKCEAANPQRAVPRDITRQIFQHAARAMIAYRLPQNWPDGTGGKPLHAFPLALAYIGADFLRYFLAGKTPGPVADLLRQGTPSNGPEELRDQGWAVAYHLAADEGLIADRKPTATLSDAYDVVPRTIQRWMGLQAKLGSAWRDLVPETEHSAPADYIVQRMRAAGARYIKKGRLATPRGPGLKAPPTSRR